MDKTPKFCIHINKLDLENVDRDIIANLDKMIKTKNENKMSIIEEIISVTLKYEGQPLKCNISIVFTSNKMIRQMNKQYLGIDRETDVLCFPYRDKPPFECDIIISVEKAYQQCKIYGNTFYQEISILIIHAILHLLGWKDNNDRLRQNMYNRQKEIFKKICFQF
jgi:probable rRNA maturation factor